MLRTFRRALLSTLPEPLAKIIRCMGAPNKFIHFPDPTYNKDELVTRHNCDFRRDPRFAEAYAQAKATNSFYGGDPEWRAYVCCWAGRHALNLPGDFVECGVNKGGYSLAVAKYLDFAAQSRRFWLLDTFEGLVDECISDAERAMGRKAGGYEPCVDQVVRTFSPYPNVEIVRGAIPGTLDQVEAEQVAYLSIDLNCVLPEIAAAEHFWGRMPPGGVIVLDDYGWNLHEQQKAAFDDFAAKRGVAVLSLPTGQGLIFKP